MLETEERKMNERKREAHEQALRDEKAGKVKHKKHHEKEEKHEKDNKEQPDKGKSARG